MDEWATAKINLFLSVLDRRPDGYHNLETVFQSVGLAEPLTFHVEGEDIVLECRNETLPAGRGNLIVRAAECLKQAHPQQVRGLRIEVEKRIPVGSGLGGGSADAAATLRACNALFGLGLTPAQLREAGSRVGMDVPFLIEGGRAIGRERGDQLERRTMAGEVWAIICVADVSVATAWAYQELDRCGLHEGPSLETFVEGLESRPLGGWAPLCFNGFERVVYPRYPQIKALRERLLAEGCAGAFLSGSGSAVVGLADDPQRAEWVAERLRRDCRFAAAAPFLSGTHPLRQGGGQHV